MEEETSTVDAMTASLLARLPTRIGCEDSDESIDKYKTQRVRVAVAMRSAMLTLIQPLVIKIVRTMILHASTHCPVRHHVLPPLRSRWPQAT
jgi:hypothetical protein